MPSENLICPFCPCKQRLSRLGTHLASRHKEELTRLAPAAMLESLRQLKHSPAAAIAIKCQSATVHCCLGCGKGFKNENVVIRHNHECTDGDAHQTLCQQLVLDAVKRQLLVADGCHLNPDCRRAELQYVRTPTAVKPQYVFPIDDPAYPGCIFRYAETSLIDDGYYGETFSLHACRCTQTCSCKEELNSILGYCIQYS